MAEDKTKAWSWEPRALWMPEGSVRAIGFFGALAITGAMLLSEMEIPEGWWVILALVAKWYYERPRSNGNGGGG